MKEALLVLGPVRFTEFKAHSYRNETSSDQRLLFSEFSTMVRPRNSWKMVDIGLGSDRRTS